jgi:hypothetical protein
VFSNLEEELKNVTNAIRGESDWTLPILYALCLELRNAAVEADRRDSSGKNEHLQSAGRNLNSAFRFERGGEMLLNALF